jgi:N-acetylmuramoyl-L-alanine amidase
MKPNTQFLRASLALWRRRLRFRTRRLKAAKRAGVPKRVVHWERLVNDAAKRVGLRRQQLADRQAPRIVRARLNFENVFGALGPVRYVTGHYTAGPRDRSLDHALDLFAAYHGEHRAKGWGGIGYHLGLTQDGVIVLLRPVRLKGAHVGGWNTGNVGVVCHGTTGDEPTPAQRRAYAWLLQNAHTRAMPRSHRVDLRAAKRMGHNSWSGHESNSCPGAFKAMYLNGR